MNMEYDILVQQIIVFGMLHPKDLTGLAATFAELRWLSAAVRYVT